MMADVKEKSALACETCAKAKARCVRSNGSDICDRCARLSKQCHSREVTVRKKKVTKPTRSAQLEKLESKLENLIGALSTTQARQQVQEYPSPTVSARSSADRPSVPSLPGSYRGNVVASELVHGLCRPDSELEAAAGGSTSTSPAAPPNSSQPGAPWMSALPMSISTFRSVDEYLGVSLTEAEVLVDRFRRLMAPGFPFVIIPEDATASSMLKAKPFLLHSICLVAHVHDLAKQIQLLKSAMRDVSERMLVNGERSIDLLQGILVTCAWYHPHIFSNPQTTNLLQLGNALVKDLGLDRAPSTCADNYRHHHTKPVSGTSSEPCLRVQTLEDHRAYAGLFFLTSSFSSSFRKGDGLRYTNYLDSCVEKLGEMREYDSDVLLLQMVRVQRLNEDIHTIDSTSAPFNLHSKMFESELARLRKEDPVTEPNVFLELVYSTAEILIPELALIDLQEPRPIFDYEQSPVKALKKVPNRHHIDSLYRCFKAIKRCLEVYFTIPTSSYITIPFHVYGQFAHAFIVLLRVATLDVDGWDYSVIESELSFPAVVEEAAKRFEQVRSTSIDGWAINNDCLGRWSQRLRWMKAAFENRAVVATYDNVQQSFGDEPTNSNASTLQQLPTPPDDMLTGDFFQYVDEKFWQSFPGDFDFTIPEMAMG